tara:strand:- start:17850 stop:18437 length:588 start_codon:yes stop_codon:yes gene_type:complete
MNVLLLIGPQGSGNHIWSKVLTTWADSDYWVGHKKEPHSHLWDDMQYWKAWDFYEDTIISISCPFAVEGKTIFPDINTWKEIMNNRSIPHEIAVITRDKTINYNQNNRVRPVNNYLNSIEFIKKLEVDCFLSTETLLIYKEKYLDQLNKQLNFPIKYDTMKLHNTLSQSFNEKYIKYVDEFGLDEQVHLVSGYNV